MAIKKTSAYGILSNRDASAGNSKIVDIPDAPTIGTATAGTESATVEFTAATKGGLVTTYTALSNPGSVTGTGSSSPVTLSGLTAGTAYTFTVRGNNATGSSEYSAESNAIVPTSGAGFESIATVALSSAQSSVTFSSIPSTYKHLQVRMLNRDSQTSTDINSLYMSFNGVSGTSYSWHRIEGFGSGTPTSAGATSQGAMWIGGNSTNGYTSGIFSVHITDILDYANTNKYKTIKTLGGFDTNGTGTEPGHVSFTSGLFMNTNAITSITIFKDGQNQVANSHFALYGIKG